MNTIMSAKSSQHEHLGGSEIVMPDFGRAKPDPKSGKLMSSGGTKVLIFHTSIGLGHKSIAENIGWHLEQVGFEVRLADIGKVQSGKFEKAVTWVHKFINRRLPFVWAWLYSFGHYAVLPFRVFIAGFNYKNTPPLINEFKPPTIIATQTEASAVIAFIKSRGLFAGRFGIAFSDFHLHPYWLYKEADFYLANIVEQKAQMIAKGIPEEKIFVCGMALKPKIEMDTTRVKEKFSIEEGQKVILVGSGSLGSGLDQGYLIKLGKSFSSAKIIIVCGKNQDIFNVLKKTLPVPQFLVLGFVENMPELYAVSDIFLTKPGGLTTAEALQYNLPMLITHTLPGQEDLNYKYLIEKNLILPKTENLLLAVKQELETGQFKNSLFSNSEKDKLLNFSAEIFRAIG